MLTIKGASQRLCEGIRRRDFLKLGAVGSLSLSLPTLLRASASRPTSGPKGFGKARRCLLLFLTGGPPQLDTWDLKPQAPEQYRGELKPIATNVTGVNVSELFPRLARQADKYCILRSVSHDDHVHTTAGYTMLTGVRHPLAKGKSSADIKPGPHDHPHLGSLLAKVRSARDGLPVFAALPEVIKDAGVNTYPGLDGGFLGSRYAPFRIEGDKSRGEFRLPDIFLPRGITANRLEDRRLLLNQLNSRLTAAETRSPIGELDDWRQRAFALMRSRAVQKAFDLGREPDRVRDDYGRHLFGQGCLLARRLLEAGIALVSVYWHYEGPEDSPSWDTHGNNFKHLRERLMPPTDQAFAGLLDDLGRRGLLEDTLVVCMGEFGRSPKVNAQGGRDHWPAVQSIVLAGAGVRGGSVYGASDRVGAYPAEQPVSPADVAATILHLLGVPADLEIQDRANRPLRACSGEPIQGVLS
ncbi:MAG TPA: DUF1501 domain-containing protein [Gemmataceae bacterium]|jgi:hypothetical protein